MDVILCKKLSHFTLGDFIQMLDELIRLLQTPLLHLSSIISRSGVKPSPTRVSCLVLLVQLVY